MNIQPLIRRLGPFFGLVLVVTLFAAMLGAKDLSDQRAKNALSAKADGQTGSWWSAVKDCPFDGLQAFVSVANIKTVLSQTVIVAIGALGMTMIIISGGIDLSVGSSVALTGVITALGINAGLSTTVAVGAGILVGGVVGLINGLAITRLRVVPFIATLGMLGVGRGLAKWVAGQQTVDIPATWLNQLAS